MGEARGGERILVVEPESDLALVLETVLQDEGYRTEVAHSLPRAPNEMAEPGADLIILDVYPAPGSRARPIDDLLNTIAGRQIPVLLVSTDTRSMAVVAGSPFVVGTLAMPFDIDTLLAKVSAALAARRAKGGSPGPRAA